MENITKYELKSRFYSLHQILDFVKRYKNIFNTKTYYRILKLCSRDNLFYIVKEFNHFYNKKKIWLWIFPLDKEYFYIVENFKGTLRDIKELVDSLN